MSGRVSEGNSTTTALAADATFTGDWENCLPWDSLDVLGAADVAGKLWIDFSTNATTAVRSEPLSSGTTSDFGVHAFIPVGHFFRIRLVNGGVEQGSLELQTTMHTGARVAQVSGRMSQSLNDFSDAATVRAVLIGRDADGGYTNLGGVGGSLPVEDRSAKHVLEELLTQLEICNQYFSLLYGLELTPKELP